MSRNRKIELAILLGVVAGVTSFEAVVVGPGPFNGCLTLILGGLLIVYFALRWLTLVVLRYLGWVSKTGPSPAQDRAVKAGKLRSQGGVNRVALVQYIETAASAGQAEGAIALALKARGWPEKDVEEAFRSFKTYFSKGELPSEAQAAGAKALDAAMPATPQAAAQTRWLNRVILAECLLILLVPFIWWFQVDTQKHKRAEMLNLERRMAEERARNYVPPASRPADCEDGECNWYDAAEYCKSKGGLPGTQELIAAFKAESEAGVQPDPGRQWFWASEEAGLYSAQSVHTSGGSQAYVKTSQHVYVRCAR